MDSQERNWDDDMKLCDAAEFGPSSILWLKRKLQESGKHWLTKYRDGMAEKDREIAELKEKVERLREQLSNERCNHAL